jgi:hypothetical protein
VTGHLLCRFWPQSLVTKQGLGPLAYMPAVQSVVLNIIHSSFDFDDDRRTEKKKVWRSNLYYLPPCAVASQLDGRVEPACRPPLASRSQAQHALRSCWYARRRSRRRRRSLVARSERFRARETHAAHCGLVDSVMGLLLPLILVSHPASPARSTNLVLDCWNRCTPSVLFRFISRIVFFFFRQRE